jgi:type IV secretion system protein VirB4
MTKAKADKPITNFNNDHFIPIACHYDENTLLTKDGQLIQVLRIENVFNFGNKITGLANVRDVLREAIQKHINTDKVAFWISTIRDTVDLSDHTKYSIPFCQDVHNAWQQINNWNNSFTNTLYIAIVYQNANISIKDFTSFANSLNDKTVFKFHNSYLSSALNSLSKIVSNIYTALQIFNVTKLSIIHRNDTYYSELQSFLSKIIYLDKTDLLVKELDISKDLAPVSYIVNGDKIQINKRDAAKFATMLSIKEYQDIPTEILDDFLQLPVSMIITEIFTITTKETAIKDLEFSNYILSISLDQEFADASYIKEMLSQNDNMAFCQQQINISVIAKDASVLESYVEIAAKKLAELGIMAVKEDVDIEYAFWSRLPGNSHLINRVSYILKQYTASFSSLYHFPYGDRASVWGDAVAILKTFKHTPYFFNFHVGEVGNTCIISGKDNGKTTLLNFLLAMATKYNPEIYYVTNSDKASSFIELLGGGVLDHTCLPNPLLYLNYDEVLEWFKIICGDRIKKLKSSETIILNDVVGYLLQLPKEERLLSKIAQFNLDFYRGGLNVKSRLLSLCSGDKYKDIKFNNSIDLNSNKIVGFNLSFFTEEGFKTKNYPQDEDLIPQYLENLDIHAQMRSAMLFMLTKMFCRKNNQNPKILVISNLDNLVDLRYAAQDLHQCHDWACKNNAIVLSSVDTRCSEVWESTDFWVKLRNSLATRIVLAGEDESPKLRSFIGFSKEEMALLSSLPHRGRFFVVSQSGFTISATLNLIQYPGIAKILSQNTATRNIYQKIKQDTSVNDNLLQKLYEKFKED